MTRIGIRLCIICLLHQGISSTVLAQEQPFSLEVALGAEYNDNVSVNEIDQTSNEGDSAILFELDAGYEFEFNDTGGISLNYVFSDSRYQTFSAFDSQLHNVTATATQEFGKVTAELAYTYALSNLDGNRFLSYQRLSPAASFFLGSKWYFRGAIELTQKEFPQISARDADVDGFTVTGFYFINRTRTYLNFSYNYSEEITDDTLFSYYADTIRVRLSHDFSLFSNDWDFALGLRYQQRQYANIFPAIGEKREDERIQIDVALEMPVWRTCFLQLEASYNDNQSNLPDADYQQTVVTAQIGARL